MRLYVIRHGKAERDSASGRDEDRKLRKRGKRQAAWLAERLRDADPAPALVITSGLARALATAEPIAEACGCALEREAVLEGGHPAAAVVDLVESREGQRSVAIVGHNPQLSELVEALAETSDEWLRTGECAVIELEPGRGRVVERWRLEE
jgi:phosphohistidine phosphatase